MSRRPSLDEIPAASEYRKEIENAVKFKRTLNHGANLQFIGFLILYFGISWYLGIESKHLWFFGFSISVVLYTLLLINTDQRATHYENAKIQEYHMRHSLHRMEEIHKTINKENEDN